MTVSARRTPGILDSTLCNPRRRGDFFAYSGICTKGRMPHIQRDRANGIFVCSLLPTEPTVASLGLNCQLWGRRSSRSPLVRLDAAS
jgi:hypothetical protein